MLRGVRFSLLTRLRTAVYKMNYLSCIKKKIQFPLNIYKSERFPIDFILVQILF